MKFGAPIASSLLIATLTGAEPARPVEFGWAEVAPLPRGVAGHAAAVASGTQWVAGGSWWEGERKSIGSEVWRRSAAETAWTQVTTIPGGFAHGGWTATLTDLWLAGGLDRNGPSAKIFRIQLTAGSVAQVGELPEPRVYGGAAWLDGALYVIGGTAAENQTDRASSTWWRITPGPADTCTVLVGRIAGPAWINPVVLALHGELHVLPGSVWSAERRRLEAPSEAWIYSPKDDRWRQRPLATPLPRGLSGVTLDDKTALLAGGTDGGTMATGVWIYDAASGALTAGPHLPAGRLAGALSAAGSEVWWIGGEDRARSRSEKVWRWHRPETVSGDPR